MLALRFDGSPGLTEVPEPVPGPDEALVEITRAGICSTDLQILQGYAGFSGVMGHEGVGVVRSAPGHPQWEGRRVVPEINVACARCSMCQRGLPRHCEQRQVLGIRRHDGVFAQALCVPVANLYPVPDTVPDEAAVFTEPLAAAFRILEQVEIDAHTEVAVLGDGKLGLLIAMALRTCGCPLTVIGRHPRKLAIAAKLQARTLLSDQANPDRFDMVVEATGSPTGLAQALSLVRPCGSLVLKSTFAQPVSVDLSRVVVDELRVVGSRCGPFQTALNALADGRVDPRALIEACYPLRRGTEALEHAARRGTLKVLLDPVAS